MRSRELEAKMRPARGFGLRDDGLVLLLFINSDDDTATAVTAPEKVHAVPCRDHLSLLGPPPTRRSSHSPSHVPMEAGLHAGTGTFFPWGQSQVSRGPRCPRECCLLGWVQPLSCRALDSALLTGCRLTAAVPGAVGSLVLCSVLPPPRAMLQNDPCHPQDFVLWHRPSPEAKT